jgi:hypothetical protein
MEIPFISPKQMHNLYNNSTMALSDVTSYSDMAVAGSLYINTINQIKSASATPSTVSVQVYVWASNVQLGCTTGTVIQVTTESGQLDEREKGPIENVASRVAEVSQALTKVPFIAPFAKASSLIFRGVAGFSAIFGWSYPRDIKPCVRVRNQPFSNGANSIGVAMGKLIALDPKQELSVDPRVVAMSEDEMVFTNIAAIETYLATFDWLDDSVPMSANLWKVRVSPQLGTRVVGTGDNPTCIQPTPMAMVASYFQYWRGTIEFRFDIVCSKYHKGKIAILYDPNVRHTALIEADLDTNKQFMKIVDIQETQSFTLCVDWASPRAAALLSCRSNRVEFGRVFDCVLRVR